MNKYLSFAPFLVSFAFAFLHPGPVARAENLPENFKGVAAPPNPGTWTINYASRLSKDFPQDVATTGGLKSKEVMLSNGLMKVTDTTYDGQQSTHWQVEKIILYRDPRWPKGQTSLLTESDPLYKTISGDFSLFSLATPQNYQTTEQKAGKTCYRFSLEKTICWIDKITLLPVAVETEIQTVTYSFSSPTFTQLKLPDEVVNQFKKYIGYINLPEFSKAMDAINKN